jgi:hypothetical protein
VLSSQTGIPFRFGVLEIATNDRVDDNNRIQISLNCRPFFSSSIFISRFSFLVKFTEEFNLIFFLLGFLLVGAEERARLTLPLRSGHFGYECDVSSRSLDAQRGDMHVKHCIYYDQFVSHKDLSRLWPFSPFSFLFFSCQMHFN